MFSIFGYFSIAGVGDVVEDVVGVVVEEVVGVVVEEVIGGVADSGVNEPACKPKLEARARLQ